MRPGFRERPKKKAKGDPRRNVHQERGRAVVVKDITPYARPKCTKCRGNGISSTMKDAVGQAIGAMPCRCAHERFMKAHPEIIVEATGAAYWPADDSAVLTGVVPAGAEEADRQAATEPGKEEQP